MEKKKKKVLSTAGVRRRRVPLPCFKSCPHLSATDAPSEDPEGMVTSAEEGYEVVEQ